MRLGVFISGLAAHLQVAQPWRLAAAAVYWRSCGTGHGGEGANVVKVAVRDEDCDRLELSVLDDLEDAGGFGPWVDDQACRLVRTAHQVAISLVRADGELEGSGGDRRLLDVRTGRGRNAAAAGERV
jgi:hypothetical protein